MSEKSKWAAVVAVIVLTSLLAYSLGIQEGIQVEARRSGDSQKAALRLVNDSSDQRGVQWREGDATEIARRDGGR